MPKINFNVPFLRESGDAIKRPKFDHSKIKVDANGGGQPTPVLDEEGNIVHETVTVKEMLVQLLQMPHEDDKTLSFEERSGRGKLARKIAVNNSCSYNDNDIKTIEEYSRRNGSTVLLAQIDDLLRGVTSEFTEEAA